MYRYIKSLRFVVFPLFLTIISCITRNAQGGEWSRTGDVRVKKSGANFSLLSDGKVIACGGLHFMSVYEIFDPAIGTWSPAILPTIVDHSICILLPNGKALLADRALMGNIWFYDSTWSQSGASFSNGWYYRAPGTLLKDGMLLGINHPDNRQCELYDCGNDRVDPTGSVHYTGTHLQGVEVMLPDGKVLVLGSSGGTRVCEIYHPGSKTWILADSLITGRSNAVGVLLPPPWSQVLVAGGNGAGDKCELYDPLSNSWSSTGPLNFSKRVKSAMALLPSGEVLIAGGNDSYTTCELYDPAGKTWNITDTMETGRDHYSLIILPTGKVLAAGSYYGNLECEIYDPSEGAWAGKPDLKVGRAAHTTTPLPIIHIPDVCSTNILISGGENSTGALASCEVYNYSLDRGALTGGLNEARSYHTAILLADGKVLVAGGKDGVTTRSSSELYDVSTELWTTTTGAMTNARFDHSATLLKNGDVLVTGGEDAGYLSSCEIYNSGNWTPTANVMATPRARHTAIILLDGNILVIGGQTTGGGATATCELWNGATWTNRASMSTARYWHTATLLQSGKVLVTGGTSDGTSGLSSCEIFDPDSNKWFPEGSLNTARHSHNAMLLYSGLVLVTGGNNGANSCEIWDPAAEWDPVANTHQWKVTGSLTDGRAYHSSALIPRDKPYVLAIGGKNGTYLKSIEEYDVGLGYREIWQSEITNYPAVTPISKNMDIEGTLFRGVSEADGGNYCHIVSNDHPIISLVRIGGGNWQGNGGGGLLYMPLSTSWDAAHTNVDATKATAFKGYYMMWSIVNGIPCKWYEPCPAGTEEKTGERHKATGISVSVYPNPATEKIVFRYSLPVNRHDYTIHDSRLTIYDLSGRLVRSLTITDNRTPNTEITWDRKDSEDRKVKSGIYFYRLNCKDSEIKGKFVILK